MYHWNQKQCPLGCTRHSNLDYKTNMAVNPSLFQNDNANNVGKTTIWAMFLIKIYGKFIAVFKNNTLLSIITDTLHEIDSNWRTIPNQKFKLSDS